LKFGLNQGEGFIIITGEIGAGKTTLVGRLVEDLDKDKFVVAKIVTTMMAKDNALRMVSSAFGLDIDGRDKALLLSDLEKFLQNNHKSDRRALLLVDEAQNLPTEALEELRMLSNFQVGGTALLQSFLVGQPEFRQKWAYDPALEQLRQRVIATHHLQAMTFEETKEYIFYRLGLVGWTEEKLIFEEEAFDRIYENTKGVPRKLNTLCSRILLFGAIEEVGKITGDMVAEVISDMEFDVPGGGAGNPIAALGAAMYNNNLSEVNNFHGGEIEARILKLEQHVALHDETIKNALDLASVWLTNEPQEAENK
jgi:type II secretory pathway predicted ATPase ExeA